MKKGFPGSIDFYLILSGHKGGYYLYFYPLKWHMPFYCKIFPEMRKIFYTILIIICFTGCALSQVPQALNYQAILRNAFGQALTDREVYLRVSIVQGTITGSTVY
jgi:PhoPQ-activated pathogenicity-related protein